MYPGALPLGWGEPVQEREVRLPQRPEQRQRLPRLRGGIATGLGPEILIERLDRGAGSRENQPDPVGTHELIVGEMGDDLLNGPFPRSRAAGAERLRCGREQLGQPGGSSREQRERLATGQVAADAGLVLRLRLGHNVRLQVVEAACGWCVACCSAHASAYSAISSHPCWAGMRCERPGHSLISVIVFDL